MVKWVVQSNLGKHYFSDIENACKKLGLDFVPQPVIPFSDELPKVSADDLTIFYGATNWINTIYKSKVWRPGTFFNPQSTVDYWMKKYKMFCLNYGSEITTLNKVAARNLDDKDQFFIRPCSDNKEFAGTVMSFKDIKDWQNMLVMCGDVDWVGNMPIILGQPHGISNEWRLFMIDGRVSSGSHYREYHKLKETPDVPPEVIEFAEERADEYTPAPVFVMDIGRSGDELWVIEIGCFNSAGFYAADVEKIVKDVSVYVENNIK